MVPEKRHSEEREQTVEAVKRGREELKQARRTAGKGGGAGFERVHPKCNAAVQQHQIEEVKTAAIR